MIAYENRNWLKVTFSWQGTSLPRIYPRLLFLVFLALAIWLAGSNGYAIPRLEPLGHSMIGIALGMLLVFRNGSSYDRYWEGRKSWGAIVGASRQLARLASVHAQDGPAMARLLSAYAVATRARLRDVDSYERELAPLMTPEEATLVKESPNHPLAIAALLSGRVRQGLAAGRIQPAQFASFENQINDLIANTGACERIRSTPIPFCHSAHIKQLLFVYLGSLPFVMVPAAGGLGVVLTAIVSFALIGIEESGVEIEDPFGDDANDLPVDDFCATINRECTALSQTVKDA